MPLAAPEAYLAHIQKQCLPGVWSKGVALQRADAVKADSIAADEIVLRVQVKDRPVSPKVSLWPDDEDWYCDCGDRADVCAHVAAAVIALRSGSLSRESAADSSTSSAHGAQPGAPQPSSTPRIVYRFTRKEGRLEFERVIEHAGREVPIPDTLVALVGGIRSGRITMPDIPATREDFAVDTALANAKRVGPRSLLDSAAMLLLFKKLAGNSHLTLDGKPVRVSSRPTGLKVELTDPPGTGGGFKLSSRMDPTITEVFTNGAALCGDELLAPLLIPRLEPRENEALSVSGGRLFRSPQEIAHLVSELLPELEIKLPVAIRTERLPLPVTGTPKVSVRLEPHPQGGLSVVAGISYPDPVLSGEVLIPDAQAEHALARKLRSELHLVPNQPARFEGSEALDFALKLQGQADWIVQGEGARRFGVASALTPHFEVTEEGFKLRFEAAGRLDPAGQAGQSGQAHEADPAQVLKAWNEGAEFVPLLGGGGWAPLPRDWLQRYGARVLALLEARAHDDRAALPRYLLPELAELGSDLGVDLPEALRQLRARLQAHDAIPEAPLPADLRAELRDYQRQGINWLCWLRDSGMGALLADDMGLGKTLQALCAIRGRTLVICPTSVVSAWSSQIERFRPGLKIAIYHGADRKLDAQADVTLTTYAVLRLDLEALRAQDWETLVLDEAQTIKNPSSQVARAAHSLRGAFRLALSGTPVENRLDDLWSQFQFVNPGLLGSRTTFQQEFGRGIASGQADAAARLRTRIRPFVLRRLKREVARELPPRTESVLHCELTESEREHYGALLASSRREVLEKLEQDGNVLAALELLLRLRQVSCSPRLVPGLVTASTDSENEGPSSKIRLLLEELTEATAQGHRSLVFSQWTSMLDLIEPELKAKGIAFLRLDGSTRDRQAVVDAFQAPTGPPVFIISLKAGGTGLTLTAADHVYLMDPWWNPAVEDQAADRAHRIGQENPVFVHRLVARDTVEERILALQKYKQELAGSVLEGGAASGPSLTRDDLMALLND